MDRYNIEPSGWNLRCSICNCLIGDTLDSESESEKFAASIGGVCSECGGE